MAGTTVSIVLMFSHLIGTFLGRLSCVPSQKHHPLNRERVHFTGNGVPEYVITDNRI